MSIRLNTAIHSQELVSMHLQSRYAIYTTPGNDTVFREFQNEILESVSEQMKLHANQIGSNDVLFLQWCQFIPYILKL